MKPTRGNKRLSELQGGSTVPQKELAQRANSVPPLTVFSQRSARPLLSSAPHRPQTPPNALQRKSVSGHAPHMTKAPRKMQPPAAPPVYRPQPTPLVLQRNTDAHRSALQSTEAAVSARRLMLIPKVLQTKAVGKQSRTTPAVGRADAPPVYRPEPRPTQRAQVAPVQLKETRRPSIRRRTVESPARMNRGQAVVEHRTKTVQLMEQHNRISYPTIYTHMTTRPTSQVNPTPQGPHTVAHSFVSHGFNMATEDQDWDMLGGVWGTQIPNISDVQATLDFEQTANLNTSMKARRERYLETYEDMYDQAEQGINAQLDFDTTCDQMRELMELHPYQTSSWKTGNRAAHKSTAGKGEGHYLKKWLETGDREYLMKLLDLARCRFNDKQSFKRFIEDRLEMAGVPRNDIQWVLQQI
ncbi:MAG TPA: hypothetical protein VEW46_02755 [Pyrinomonadaceae bacterium]|nr:hypothetical protein [Pyrinomonadaceae bacterium]